MKRLVFIFVFIVTVATFAMDRPVRPGQELKHAASPTLKAIEACCCDQGYCTSCTIGCTVCCGASIRYVGYALLLHQHCRSGWKYDYNSAKEMIHYAEGGQIVASALALAGINTYYFHKHYKQKKD